MKAISLLSSGIDSPVAAYSLSSYVDEIIFLHADARPFTDDELKVYLEVLPRLKSGQINGQDNATLTKLYNKVFNANKKPTRCTSCVKETIAKLAKVYVNTCEV